MRRASIIIGSSGAIYRSITAPLLYDLDGYGEMARRLFTFKNLIRAALTAFSLANMGIAHAQAASDTDGVIVSFVAVSSVR